MFGALGLAQAQADLQRSLYNQPLQGLQSFGGQGLGRAIGGSVDCDPYSKMVSVKLPETIREELQNDVDEWLKDSL